MNRKRPNGGSLKCGPYAGAGGAQVIHILRRSYVFVKML